MGSSLIQLNIDSPTTARTIATLLSVLPLLEILAIHTKVEDNACEIELASSIPFFNLPTVGLSSQNAQLGPAQSTAHRFEDQHGTFPE